MKMAVLAEQLTSTGHLPGLEAAGDIGLTDAHHRRRAARNPARSA